MRRFTVGFALALLLPLSAFAQVDPCDPNPCDGGVCSQGEIPSGGEFCGGAGGVDCPFGLGCVDDPSDDCDPDMGGDDCAGICIPVPCGGAGGIPCASGFVCVEDPSDDCDPDAGDVDCIGVCIEEPGFLCDAPVPAVSSSALAVLILLMLTSMTIAALRRLRKA